MSNLLASYLQFFWAGLAQHGQTGGVVPSQRFLIAKMLAPIPSTYRGQLIELGAGTGALTLQLAARCPQAQILACELNPTLAGGLRSRLAQAGLSRRVELLTGSAGALLSELASGSDGPADFIVSGIPLGNLGRAKALELIDAVWQSLKPGGMYIQFQHSLLDRKKLRSRFRQVRTVGAWLNFPPAVVYYASR